MKVKIWTNDEGNRLITIGGSGEDVPELSRLQNEFRDITKRFAHINYLPNDDDNFKFALTPIEIK